MHDVLAARQRSRVMDGYWCCYLFSSFFIFYFWEASMLYSRDISDTTQQVRY